MTKLQIPIPTDEEIAENDTSELHEFLGDIERGRYKLSDVEHRIMVELDDRESNQ